jgi:hypothetical protein
MTESAFFKEESCESTPGVSRDTPPDESRSGARRPGWIGWIWAWRSGDARAIAFWTLWAFLVCLRGLNGDFLGAHRSRFLEISREILVR